AASNLRYTQAPGTVRELFLEHDPGAIGLDFRRERRDRRHSGEIAVRVLGELVLGEGVEGLAAQPSHGLDGDERQQAILARQGKLRVDPFDLDHAADVGVEVQTAVGVDLAPRGLAAVGGAELAGAKATRGPAIVAREPTVVGPGLPILQVDLEAEHGLDPSDRELEVRTEPGPRVPLLVAVARQVAV